MTKEIKHDYEVPEGWEVVEISHGSRDLFTIDVDKPMQLMGPCSCPVPIIQRIKPESNDTLRFTLDWDGGYSRFNFEEHNDGMYWVSQANDAWNGFYINSTRYAFSHYEKDGAPFSLYSPSRSDNGYSPVKRADTIVFKRFELEEKNK